MNFIKKALRLTCLLLGAILISVGVALAGGIPLNMLNRREETGETKTELVEPREEAIVQLDEKHAR